MAEKDKTKGTAHSTLEFNVNPNRIISNPPKSKPSLSIEFDDEDERARKALPKRHLDKIAAQKTDSGTTLVVDTDGFLRRRIVPGGSKEHGFFTENVTMDGTEEITAEQVVDFEKQDDCDKN